MKRFLLIVLVLLVTLSGCGAGAGLVDKIDALAYPSAFSLLRWEVGALSKELVSFVRHPFAKADPNNSALVMAYFDLVAQENDLRRQIDGIQGGFTKGDEGALQERLELIAAERIGIEREVEEIVARQLSLAAASLGIYNPLDVYWNVNLTFPPVKLRLQEPPKLLVVSPRENIDRLASITLNSDINQIEIVALEEKVEELGVSAIVVGLGGIATYPSFVNNNYGLRTALDIAAEEWMHQYLFFRPLGFRYALHELGISQPLDTIVMNETFAGMVASEIAAEAYAQFYSQSNEVSAALLSQPVFDFYGELCQTRSMVDILLEQGMVDEAETYMEARRQEFAEHGYYIRKLNQAYFAFYGCYANQPGFENPIGVDLQTLRDNSSSLAGFVQIVSSFSGREDLARAVS